MIANLIPYPKMKNSGIEWLGVVPKHWEVLPNRALFAEVKERGHPEEQMLSVTIIKGVIRQQALLADSSKKDSSNQDKSAYKLVRSGDITYNKMRAWQGAVGVSDYQGIVSPAYVVERPRKGASSHYLHHLLRTPAFAKEAERWSYGITSDMWSLRPEHFKMIYGCLPPLAEQAAIVRFLDYADRRIRRYIRAKQKLIALLEEQKQALIHRTVTGQVDVRTGQPYPAYKPSGVEWLGDVPEHWTTARLKSSMNNIVEQTTERRGSDLYVALEHVESWTGRLRHAGPDVSFDSQVKYFRPGDILFGKLRPYLAKVTRPASDGVCVGEFLVLRPRHSNATAPYMEQLLRSKPVIDAVNSSTFGAKMPRTDWQFMGGMAIVHPPLPEQATIVCYLDEAAADIDDTINRTRRQIELLSEYRTRLIADVVTGKLDVRAVASKLPDEVEEPEPLDRADTVINGGEEPSNGLDAAPGEAAV